MTPPRPNPSTELARWVIDRLVAHGVTEIVVAPGSRNAPLSFAAWEAARRGEVRLHTRLDERSASFLALGLSKVAAPAAVICTSGTAVAQCHAAVLEAAHAGVPLIVISADRPASLRGTGASQTTDQVGIFREFATFLDLAAGDGSSGHESASSGHKSSVERPEKSGRAATRTDLDPALEGLRASRMPLHLNVQFTPPLVPDQPPHPVAWPRSEPATGLGERAGVSFGMTRPTPERAYVVPTGPRTVVVAGDDAGPPPRVLAEKAGWPLLAEPTSGCRTGDNALRCYRLMLDPDHPLGSLIERVIVAGHPTLSRPVAALLAREDVEVISLQARGIWSQRPFPVDSEHDLLDVDAPELDAEWLAAWQAADRELGIRLESFLGAKLAEGQLTPWHVVGAVAAAVGPSDLLVVGASSPIRDLDLMTHGYRVGDRRKLISNRGLAGIDGTISTAIGAALGRPHSGRAFALMGDVTFVHEANGLVLGPGQPTPDLTIVVVNDDGGSIFTTLEQGAERYGDAYDALFGTPHGVDVASLCAATRTPHWRVDSLPELEQALSQPHGGIEVVEVKCRRDNRRELEAAITALAE